MAIDLDGLLKQVGDRTAEKLDSLPDVIEKGQDLDVTKLPINSTWHRLADVVCVVADLERSTNLAKGRTPAGVASIYDAGVGSIVRILASFGADFIDIQGDAAFALFWDERRYERAFCAAMTIRTYNPTFTKEVHNRWPKAASTGFKVGVASGPVLVKRVGPERQVDFQEPVWAGRPVNYAVKTAQQGATDRLLVTGSVWDVIGKNDYIAFSCGCDSGVPGREPSVLWKSIELEKIPDGQRHGTYVGSTWCSTHGQDFCTEIMAGKTARGGIPHREMSKRNLLDEGTVLLKDASRQRAEEKAASLKTFLDASK
ncbi:adenylate/guanylate cyclase domain-containing protein [Microcella alkaliphila]|uniref:adenylate/guanylate cyclase domain-containing protein n=1 Tax=Microcella alkaliphila TaxID=279828 RepID=UPI00137478DD|nr:adenylate/guanylate cyclase domain-containing protein [Microcella alkaliphila]